MDCGELEGILISKLLLKRGDYQMTNIELKYDSFNIKTILTVDGKEETLRCFGTGKGARLHDWIISFFPEIIDRCNLGPGSECTVQFHGSQSDYTDVQNAYTKYREDNKDIEVKLPEYKRYPQSLSEIKEYTVTKKAEYEKDIKAKEQELEKVNFEIAEKAKLEADKEAAKLDDLERKISKSDEMLEEVNQGELEKLKNDMMEFRNEIKSFQPEEKALDPSKFNRNSTFSHFTMPLLDKVKGDFGKIPDLNATEESLKEWVNQEFTKISNYPGSFADNACNVFNNHCKKYLSEFSTLVDGLQIPKEAPKIENYSIIDTDKVPWKFNRRYSDYKKMIEGAVTASQEYLNTIIDEAEQHCTKTLSSIKVFYKNEMKTVLANVSEALNKKRSSLASEIEKFSSASEDKLSLEKEIVCLKAKMECLADILVEIDRIHGD